MIRVEGLTFGYSRRPVFAGLDLTVNRGEILGVLGPNGCGKSTLLRLLRGTLFLTAGRIHWDGRPLASIGRQEMARLVAVVPQTASAVFPFSVREVVAMGRFAYGRSGGQAVIEGAMAVTDVTRLAERPVTALSGGELQRVMLARALAQETPVLFLDEASSHLDLDHRLAIAELLHDLNRQRKTTILQVSHDLDQAAETSHRLLLISAAGEAVALGPPRDVLTEENIERVFKVAVRVDPNPYTGAPRVLPLSRCSGTDEQNRL